MEKKNYKILVVDDEIEYQRVFSYLLKRNGYDVITASGARESLNLLESNEINLIMTDLKMPDMDGLELVKAVKSEYEDIDIMIITAFGSIESAVEAMKYGACGYSIKNSEPEALLADVDRLAKIKMLEKENKILTEQNSPDSDIFLKSKSPAYRDLLETCRQIADSDINVLLLGESGVGKEVAAKYIHDLSSRKARHFIPVNCQVFGEGTLESELFGHEKGAFTGANEKRIGRFEAADHGTLFLDEIGDIPLSLQGKLLRVLENRTIERVGSNKPIALDIRLISATNKDLEEEITHGLFREDLLYRINTMTVTVPPLRRRKEDLPDMIEFFIRKIEKEQKKKILDIEPLTLDFLYQYDYPGNIRELKNLLERMVALSDDGILRSRGFAKSPSVPADAGTAQGQREVLPLRTARGIFEKEHIENALAVTGGNVAAAAKLLDITKRQLWNKIAEYKIQR